MIDPVDLLVKGTVVDVTTGSFEDRAIAVDDGEIVGFGEHPASRVLEAAYVTPGLIDAHTHIEASMVTIPQYGEAVVPHGVTSVIHDPHEIANVLGPAGVRNFGADADSTPLKPRMTVPSSVPATPLQDAGGSVDAAAVDDLLAVDQAVALGEVMDLPAVLNGDEEIHTKITAARDHGLTVDGHIPGVTDASLQDLARYLDTDHESVTLDEARAKADAGFRVYLREGSTSKNLEALVDIVEEVDTRRLSLCTDDRSVVDILENGGINEAVQKAMELGVAPVTAVQMATLNTAEAYDLPFGRIEPGAPADLVLLSELESWSVEHVIIDGVVDPTADSTPPNRSAVATDTVTFDPVDPSDLAIEHTGSGPVEVRVESAIGSFRTERRIATVPVDTSDPPAGTDGVLVSNCEADVLPMAVIERHGGPGNVGCGFVHNLGLERGAIGTTVAHDAHNCIVAGVSHTAIVTVANHLREVDGGIAVFDPVSDALTTLPLPVAGLISDAPIDETANSFEAVVEAAADIGLSVPGGILELTYLALEVIPTDRLTNNGLVDVEAGEYVDVVVE
ncbi:adenine deaminase [Halohasta litchfieldiae]|uniref:Adenine deaminase n=1 Tax=Halohasta litchfieldiae TaxID=1073996 RepID=A0A1H6RWE5_9EURY|nr:adenine deaminase C-terminal domain-containing protein [Halohasta litchfieldiae]ATW89357.1 adenine deaminase [Halohasta litchfieldiae]SEI60061.1 Adenine deaminase [Halohasta litchfieldiae]